MQVYVNRKQFLFSPDPSRIIARFLHLSDERSADIIRNVLAMPKEEVNIALSQLLRGYSRRHRNISRIFENHFARLSPIFDTIEVNEEDLSIPQKALIGSYFTMEYSIESAAFFNPSVVEDPDQSGLRTNEKRVIFSFRATGEGHISSIVFRSGIIDRNNDLIIEPVGKMLAEADKIIRNVYEKKTFKEKLSKTNDRHDLISPDFIFDKLQDTFTYGELMKNLAIEINNPSINEGQIKIINQMMWLASSHYEINFSIDSAISERVIFPVSATEQKGIEDARFVKFTDDNGEIIYYGTYTAYDGITIMPKLISTTDFYNFKILPINGEIAQNKGMALFPRKIKGKYTMLCRIDGVNNYIAYSDSINVWREAKIIQQPKYPWELVQIGNAGSPIETEDGWLVITHAVGPMREYTLGASLYELDNPEKEIGRLTSPLMEPNEVEREGYVPNVIYSCGSIIHNDDLILPYAMSDHSSTYATINLRELLDVLKASGKSTQK
ncbi:MAG: glycosidase [Bacteroidetes bacterium GWF2_42_66]|nr:MAG: glycosidase [Bacteroidetes bacterium GWA2_42_15]OFX97506.1 MAG: glycosidase [Bacteroidetes bacterium GWE2_42_39]OFY43850.1 MAG: glycosidase [Bacteroidetes bacterium GWF2_42_66]HBL76220.1 glycosidase [Prolixibacteraceae bacterium]HCU60458.1 glycosidase [Prolixibacteraceae bacterium]